MKDPLLLDIPDAFETERLLVRAPRAGDGPEICRAVNETLDSLRPWMPWAQEPATPEISEMTARRARVRFLERSDLMLLLFLKGSDVMVGASGLHRIDWAVPRFEIGYWCRQRFQGLGYISEAVRGLTGFAFETLGAARVEIHMDSRNLASRQVAEAAGYPLEGEMRNHSRAVGGELRDTLVFALTADDYRRPTAVEPRRA
ncbi:MAG: GNAT family protein [Anaerolineae bacterium]